MEARVVPAPTPTQIFYPSVLMRSYVSLEMCLRPRRTAENLNSRLNRIECLQPVWRECMRRESLQKRMARLENILL